MGMVDKKIRDQQEVQAEAEVQADKSRGIEEININPRNAGVWMVVIRQAIELTKKRTRMSSLKIKELSLFLN